MPSEQERQPDAELNAPADADIEQPVEGPSESPESGVDAYVKSLRMDYNDELNLSLVSDEMLPQVAARLAQTNPEAARRMALRHSDYTTKRQRDAEAVRVAEAERQRLEQLAATLTGPQQQPTQPYTGYDDAYVDPASAQLGQRLEQVEQYLRNMQVEMNKRTIEQNLDEVVRRHPDMTAPGAREELLQFQLQEGIRDSERAYWAMKGPDAVAKALTQQQPPVAPQVPPSGSGPTKPPPPRTPEEARGGIVGFLRKHGVPKADDLR